jgi:hypothetical protein
MRAWRRGIDNPVRHLSVLVGRKSRNSGTLPRKSCLGLRACLREFGCAPRRYRVSPAKHSNCPMVPVRTSSSRVPDSTAGPAPRIYHQLGTGTELPPLSGRIGPSRLLPLAEVAGELSETLGAALRHEHGHLAQPGRSRRLERGTTVAHQVVNRGSVFSRERKAGGEITSSGRQCK